MSQIDRQRLISDNINLVYYIISHEYPTYLRDEDIIQSGMLGLCKAANAWKEQGLFSSYAGKCIRNEIANEFIARKPYSKILSLDAPVGDGCTLGDVIQGDDDISYIDEDGFLLQLTSDEQWVLKLDRAGYSVEEISQQSNFDPQKVRKLLRIIKLKWRNYNEC